MREADTRHCRWECPFAGNGCKRHVLSWCAAQRPRGQARFAWAAAGTDTHPSVDGGPAAPPPRLPLPAPFPFAGATACAGAMTWRLRPSLLPLPPPLAPLLDGDGRDLRAPRPYAATIAPMSPQAPTIVSSFQTYLPIPAMQSSL